RSVFERNRSQFAPGLKHKWIGNPSEVTDEPVLFIHDLGGDTSGVEFGKRSRESGQRALAYLKSAGEKALSGSLQAVVTAPVNKEAIGNDFHGQTDFLAGMAGCPEFGRADIDVLAPAVKQCAGEGIVVSGPHSADSLYFRAHSGEFDVVIAPYHDQGLIPVKLIAHGEAVNVTLGLPYVRTSPDHGTAFSIAGKGQADPAGMRAAMECAVDLVGRVL